MNKEQKTMDPSRYPSYTEEDSAASGDMIPSSRTQKYKNLLGGILCPEKVKLMQ